MQKRAAGARCTIDDLFCKDLKVLAVVGVFITQDADRAQPAMAEFIEEEILPGVSVLFAPGHTPGHMAVSFTSDGERLLYSGDTVLHPLHLEHPDWLPVYDILPEPAAASKKRIFDWAASTQSWVLGQHFPPFPNLGQVVKKEIGWEWQPIANDRSS